MAIAIYPGSFDPVTRGHLDIIARASRAVDKLIIGVLVNREKQPLFTIGERVEMIEECVREFPNVEVRSFGGLTVDFARDNGATIIIRGLRAVTDFEYEMQIAQTNHIINPNVDTMFFTTSLEYAYLSSTIAKEVAFYGNDVSRLVPDPVARRMAERLRQAGADASSREG